MGGWGGGPGGGYGELTGCFGTAGGDNRAPLNFSANYPPQVSNSSPQSDAKEAIVAELAPMDPDRSRRIPTDPDGSITSSFLSDCKQTA